MKQFQAATRLVFALLVTASGFAACFAEPPSSKGRSLVAAGGEGGDAPSGTGGAGGEDRGPACVARPAVEGAECRPVTSSEQLRQRVTSDLADSVVRYSVESLFRDFNGLCGGCHVDQEQGGFRVSRGTDFPNLVNDRVLAAIRSDTKQCELNRDGSKKDAGCVSFMPPDYAGGKPWSERKDHASDAVVRFAGLLDLWLKAGKPSSSFDIPGEVAGASPYTIDADFAETFTNIGTCVPDAGMVATELEGSCALDAKFAALAKDPDSPDPQKQLGLPGSLDETDLTTFDSAELARHGVVAYAPAYPLWSDDAGKLRHVRVPQGQSIRFNKKTRQFDIPKNTRFYKTFMRKILDRDGVERYRKVETRIIVSRPGEDSLFGTYLWNESETQATLHVTPLNNGHPFKDLIKTVTIDVAGADQVYAEVKAGKVRNESKELDYRGLVRRYAVPSSERCVHCHMGGVGKSFILGFMPLDIYMRPCDRATLDAQGHCDGGIIEPASGDELTQLERLISYGIISNYDIATELVSLEDPQGPADAPRKFRSQEELTAQGYLLGNCSHCHNPDGYPSVLNPELAPLLDFRPGKDGGVFQFPLERYSPRITRQLGKVQLPYITPSLRDIVSMSLGKKSPYWTEKTKGMGDKFIDAPWRSLIYRNVDAPFTYGDDLAIFPHMPLDTPGFDCRAPRIIGEWMVNIPALRKRPDLLEDATPDNEQTADNEPQPYVELQEGDPQYFNAVVKAQQRLETFRNGLRGNNYCPDTKDIIDVFGVYYSKDNQTPRDGEVPSLPKEGVPDRPHWVETDVTEPPGAWSPRSSYWKDVLIEQNFARAEKTVDAAESMELRKILASNLDRQKAAVALLHDLKPSQQFKDFARAKLPFGIWQQKDTCDFKDVKKVGAYGNPPLLSRPRWMAGLPDDAPVYETRPGAAVFNMICLNCHGPNADSQGRQAVTLLELSGGKTRVANFRTGLFGPPGDGGKNIERVFGSEDMALRYLPWMALGGTESRINPIVLNLVSATPVLGVPRPEAPPVVNANMLETARELCKSVVRRGLVRKAFNPDPKLPGEFISDLYKGSPLIRVNGDAELWIKLCRFENPAPVHIVDVDSRPGFTLTQEYYDASVYPANTPIGNVAGASETALSADNDFAWCVKLCRSASAGACARQNTPAEIAFVEAARTTDNKKIPECPIEYLTDANRWATDTSGAQPKLEAFATRGAINAGWAVFYYLDEMISKGKGREPAYTECELLNQAPKP